MSPPAVRRAVAGYAAEQGWAPAMTSGAMREGMALALAIGGLVTRTAGEADVELWGRSVPTTYDVLQELTGLDRSGVRKALEVLAAAGIARSTQDDAGLLIGLSSETVWSPHPLLASAPWPLLSLALTRANAPLRAALVVFAELALDTETGWRAQSPFGLLVDQPATPSPPSVWLELTLKELSHRVGYHLSHVENALGGLEAAGCLTRLRGSTGRALRLAPWTVGAAEPPAALLQVPAAASGGVSGHAVESPNAAGTPGAAGEGIVVEFQGVRAILAPGDTLDFSGRDADGRRVLRVQTEDGDIVIRPPRPR